MRSLGSLATIALVLVTVLIGSLGQYTLKLAMGQVGRVGTPSSGAWTGLLVKALSTPLVWIGLGLYGLGAVTWMVVLSRLPLSKAYPFLGLQYLFVFLVSWLLLNEQPTVWRFIGTALICVGVAVISRS